MRILLIMFALASHGALAGPGMADVKYRGPVSLAPFVCTDTGRANFIRRICYDRVQAYMLIDLSGTWYHYCEMDPVTVEKLKGSDAALVFNTAVKGSGKDGPFDCRTHRMPRS